MDTMVGILSYGLGTLVAIVVVIGLVFLFISDITQKKHGVLRNYPIVGHLRYFFEELGEYFRQYFFAGDRDEMPFNRSTRDGFAVRTADAAAGTWLAVAGQVRAGTQWEGALPGDAAIEIMTGAPVPNGADAVVMLEHVERSGSGELRAIRLVEGRTISPGENIVCRGAEALAGDELLAAGTEMDAAAVALVHRC